MLATSAAAAFNLPMLARLLMTSAQGLMLVGRVLPERPGLEETVEGALAAIETP